MKIHPLLKLAVSQPHLLAEHAAAYAALVADEAKKVSTHWVRSVALYIGAAFLAAIGILLVGVSLLVAAATLPDQRSAGWALFVVPACPLLVAVVLVILARARVLGSAFESVKAQMRADKALLNEISAP